VIAFLRIAVWVVSIGSMLICAYALLHLWNTGGKGFDRTLVLQFYSLLALFVALVLAVLQRALEWKGDPSKRRRLYAAAALTGLSILIIAIIWLYLPQ
jgi:hypothetical protein